MEHVIRLSEQDLMGAEPILDAVLDNMVDAAALINQHRQLDLLS